MTDFVEEMQRLEVAIRDDDPATSGTSGIVFHLYQPAVLTGKTTDGAAPDFRYLLMPVRLSG